MGAKTKLRLHYGDGSVITEPLTKTAHENGTTVAGARALVAEVVWAVAQVRVWTNEDGKRFVFADDLADAMGVPRG